MWMNEFEYVFVQDSINKKSVANSARRTRTHCGKSGPVRFPSDNLTKKELKAMNGEVIKYKSLKNPMSWEDFKVLPDDLKKEYVMSIRDRFGATDVAIAEMLGVSAQRLGLYLRDIGCGKGMGVANKKWAKEEFLAWRSGADMNASIAPVVEEPTEPEPATPSDTTSLMSDKGFIPVIPAAGSMTFRENHMDDILQTVAALLNCGCGVRYNCTITWECIPPEEDVSEQR